MMTIHGDYMPILRDNILKSNPRKVWITRNPKNSQSFVFANDDGVPLSDNPCANLRNNFSCSICTDVDRCTPNERNGKGKVVGNRS